jgi:hypothetical protein
LLNVRQELKINGDALMKKILQIVLCILVSFIFCYYVFAKAPVTLKTAAGGAKVTELEGTAKALCEGQKDFRNLKVSDTLKAGCEVSTGNRNRLELILSDKSIVRFDENTNFKLMQADTCDMDREVNIFISLGKIWSNVRKIISGKSGFEVSCENAVAGVRGTIYRMNVEGDKSALVKVYEGEVSVAVPVNKLELKPSITGTPKSVPGPTAIAGLKPVSMNEWIYIIKSMQQITIKADGNAEEPKEFTAEEDLDDWVVWNKARDKKY